MAVVMGAALAGAAGWNAILPLLLLGFAARLGHRVVLAPPYIALSGTLALLLLLLLLPVELLLDKIPDMDARNDRFGVVYRPVAGALAMLAVTGQAGIAAVFLALLGAALALAMHLLKVRYRRPLTGVMGGLPVPIASVAEDFLVVLISFVALLLPALGVGVLAIVAALAGWLGAVFRRRPTRDVAQASTTLT